MLAGGRWRLGGHAVEHLGERGGGPPELQHLAGELVDARGRPGRLGAAGLPEAIRDSAFPIAADCFLAALTRGEYGA